MRPHQNLFSGALGKLQNIGGSRIYTTPHTVSVHAEYSINVSYNVQGDLVGHSLDGRLWLYRRSRRLGIIALKWDAAQGKLEYAAGQNISNNDDVVLACGLDWVLTNNNIFMVSDDEPYILTARLFTANIPDTFLYSILRSGSIGSSGIDPFTGLAWGMREDNGNSEGIGYFSKDTHLLYPAGTHTFEKCYSLLPAVGDWQIFENFLVHRPDAESISSYNYMQALRPLIPLEFANGTDAYGTGYNLDHRGIQLFHRNGEIWGKGYQNIGKVSLLPAVFGEDNNVQEYYLYIQSDFTFYPYSDFFYCHISTFDVSEDNELLIHEPVLHSFAVSSVPRTWAEAKAICEALGGHLATSTSTEKNNFLVSLIGNNTIWLGGSDEVTEGSWKWVNGEEWNYTNWNSGEPNNSNDEDYIELLPSGKWNDNKSTSTHSYICEWDYAFNENDFLPCAWPNIAIASVGTDSLYGFLSEQENTLTDGACFKSTDGRVILLQSGDFLTISENNARIFFDALSYKGLLLDDNGGQLMLGEGFSDNQQIDCKTLQQWLAPAGLIDAVTNDYIAASADNAAFCTSLVTGFNRQFLSPNIVPLTATAFQDSNEDYYRLALSEGTNQNSRKVFGVNQILSQDVTPKSVEWQDIYKEPVSFSLIKVLEKPNEDSSCIPLTLDNSDTSSEDNVVLYGSYSGIPDLFIYGQEISLHMAHVRTETQEDNRNTIYYTYIDTGHSFTSTEGIAHYVTSQVFPYGDPYTELSEVNGYAILSASAKVIFLNPLDGSLKEVSFSKSFQHSFSTEIISGKNWTVQYHDISRAEIPYGIGYTENKIGFYGFIYDTAKNHLYGPYDYSEIDNAPFAFFPCASLPDFVSSLWGEEYTQPSISMLYSNSFIGWDDKNNPCNILFHEQSSGCRFIRQTSMHQDSDLDSYYPHVSYTFPNYDTKFADSAGSSRSKQNFHITEAINESSNQIKLFLFHSEVSPEIFDFPAEIERSKLP